MSDEQQGRRDPRADETGPQAGDTSIMPPTRNLGAPAGAWAGRAEVRPPPPPPDDYATPSGWDAVPPPAEPRGKWWMPILVGILVLIILGLLGWGIYLIIQSSDEGAETPAPMPSASVPVNEPTSTAPTTAPTTTAPTTTPQTTEPTVTEVTVPALVGMSQRDAQQALDRRGLSYRLIFRASDAAAGTVIDSDPAEGQKVPPDTQVTLVIAVPPATGATAPPTDLTDED